MAAVVTVQNLRKRYRRRDPWAVDGVTFDLQPGQAFGLLGPNGAGKTSVVKMIAGLLRPDSGSITLFGTEPGNPVARKDLGFSPEDPDFPKFLRASEVLDYFASLLGLDGAERKRRIPETLAFAGLDTEHRQIRQYSKGMKQRLGIAQAILGRPKLLVLDEPTADLDPIGRRRTIHAGRAVAAPHPPRVLHRGRGRHHRFRDRAEGAVPGCVFESARLWQRGGRPGDVRSLPRAAIRFLSLPGARSLRAADRLR